MTVRTILPVPLRGVLTAPPAKSYTHRALVVGHLRRASFRIRYPLDSDDTRATVRAISVLGSRVTRTGTSWSVRPRRQGVSPFPTVDCGESGTTLRLTTALAALGTQTVRFRGARSLARRPMAGLLRALRALGAVVSEGPSASGLPFAIRGPLHGGRVRVDASQSSQFVSALLLALPVVDGPSCLELVGPVVSEPYIEATVRVAQRHGIRLERRGRRWTIPGNQRYAGSEFPVPGDASSAAYFWVGAAVSGGEVRVRGIPTEWPQADLRILEILSQAGAGVRHHPDGATVSTGPLRGFTVDLTDAPDLYPLAAVLAAVTPGASRLLGASQVVFKESDRRAATVALVRAIGAEAKLRSGQLEIRGTTHPAPVRLRGVSDHRLVMASTVAALAAERPSTVSDAEAVAKSFPGFWSALAEVGGVSEAAA